MRALLVLNSETPVPTLMALTAAGFYSTWPYAIAQGSVEGPYLLVQSLLYAPLTYFLIGLEYSAGETLGLWTLNLTLL